LSSNGSNGPGESNELGGSDTVVPTVLEALTRAKEAMAIGTITPERLIATIDASSKRQRGRKVPALPEFEFPDSGYAVRVRKLGPWTMDQIRQSMRKIRKEPQVPVRKVPDMYDDSGNVTSWRNETNDADPEYKQDVKDYEAWLAEAAGYRLLDVIIASCVVVDTDDIDKKEVEAHRRALLKAGPSDDDNVELAEKHRRMVKEIPDEEIFIRCICITTNKDMTGLQEFVTSRSMPTIAEVDEQVDNFPSDVQRQADLRN
jgi:hypothetical protein